MSANAKRLLQDEGRKRVLAISAEQLQAIAAPRFASWQWLQPQVAEPPVIGRPYFVWKDDLDIARRLNDYFARDSEY